MAIDYTTILIDKKIHRKLKIICAHRNETITGYISKVVLTDIQNCSDGFIEYGDLAKRLKVPSYEEQIVEETKEKAENELKKENIKIKNHFPYYGVMKNCPKCKEMEYFFYRHNQTEYIGVWKCRKCGHNEVYNPLGLAEPAEWGDKDERD